MPRMPIAVLVLVVLAVAGAFAGSAITGRSEDYGWFLFLLFGTEFLVVRTLVAYRRLKALRSA